MKDVPVMRVLARQSGFVEARRGQFAFRQGLFRHCSRGKVRLNLFGLFPFRRDQAVLVGRVSFWRETAWTSRVGCSKAVTVLCGALWRFEVWSVEVMFHMVSRGS